MAEIIRIDENTFLWKYRDGFSINGMRGQKCFLLPKEKLVISFLSNIEQGSGGIVKSMEKNILGIF